MDDTQRHYCPECKREWSYAYRWNGKNCPACGSPDITIVKYKPPFLGADMPRPDATPLPVAAAAPNEPQGPTPFIRENPTLMLTGEVDPYVEQLAALLGEAL